MDIDSLILSYTLPQLLALLGLVQSIYILVYILLRSNSLNRAVVPLLFFISLGAAFFITVAQTPWQLSEDSYYQLSWFFWALCAPLSSLLALQIARINQGAPLFLVPLILLIPMAYGVSSSVANHYDLRLLDSLYLSAIIIGGISLLLIWLKRDWLDQLHKRKNGRERFWIIMALLILNLMLFSLSFMFVGAPENQAVFDLIRTILGLSFLYIISTGLFRIYPPILNVSQKTSPSQKDLSAEDIELALAIENLLYVEKIYQEPSFNRSKMAQELKVTESQLSKVVNGYFQKNVPLLLNELRVEEAKIFLKQTDVDVATISEESGFNSIATFNRVFKDLEGMSPTEYRDKSALI